MNDNGCWKLNSLGLIQHIYQDEFLKNQNLNKI